MPFCQGEGVKDDEFSGKRWSGCCVWSRGGACLCWLRKFFELCWLGYLPLLPLFEYGGLVLLDWRRRGWSRVEGGCCCWLFVLSADVALFAAEFGAEVVVAGCELLLALLALSFEKEVFWQQFCCSVFWWFDFLSISVFFPFRFELVGHLFKARIGIEEFVDFLFNFLQFLLVFTGTNL